MKFLSRHSAPSTIDGVSGTIRSDRRLATVLRKTRPGDIVVIEIPPGQQPPTASIISPTPTSVTGSFGLTPNRSERIMRGGAGGDRSGHGGTRTDAGRC